MKNKEYHHGGFQQQRPQGLICRYKHMNRGHDRKILRLKMVPLALFFVRYHSIEQYNKTALYFVPLQFCRHERSVAPSILNIKARGLAQCILWLKLSYNEVYEVSF